MCVDHLSKAEMILLGLFFIALMINMTTLAREGERLPYWLLAAALGTTGGLLLFYATTPEASAPLPFVRFFPTQHAL